MKQLTLEERKKRWDSLRLRLQEESKHVLKNNRQRGLAIITAHIFTDASGTPIVWVIPSGKRLEPVKDAALILGELVDGLGL